MDAFVDVVLKILEDPKPLWESSRRVTEKYSWDDFRYLGNGKYERIGKERLFRQKAGYWVGRLPRKSLEEAKGLLRPITGPSLYSEYTEILGGYTREHGLI